ncbi:MAG TPA: phosphotransferase [Dehalococcoidia bacterium]|nr:phosphotransferase [Dehalococcoidia bacterium]
MNARAFRDLLRACLPELPLRSVRRLGAGWDSDAFVVNGGTSGPLVFRFPRRADVAERIDRELRLLPALGPTLPAPIPRFSHVVRDCPAAPFPFAGYPLLRGRQLSHLRLPAGKRRELAAEIGRFLAALHAFPAARAAGLGALPADVAGGREQFAGFLQLARRRIRPLLAADELPRFRRWLASLDADEQFAFTPVVIHGDLGADHILVAAATGRLGGVIDFGDAGLGDPALDFAGLLTSPGEAFARQVLAAYGAGAGEAEAMLRRAAVFAGLSPLHELLFGLYSGDQDHTSAGLAALRRTLAACNS